jgi:alkanesulfonate monooxygenase SsuD/methylene tetrahydromethanopterin reductase-like flavin-dependent oxidoreductase (luciferase family)
LATRLEPTLELWGLYGQAAAQEGYQAGPENFGYLQPVMVADNQERAEELGKRLLFGGAFAHFARPEWMFPPGYNSKEATRRLAQTNFGPNASGKPEYGEGGEESPEAIEAVKKAIYASYPDALKDLVMIAGTPDNVIPKLKKVLDILRPGIFSFWLEGPVSFKERKRCLELINRDVIPALREYGITLGLVDPFQRKPGSVPLRGKPEPVSNPAALVELAA